MFTLNSLLGCHLKYIIFGVTSFLLTFLLPPLRTYPPNIALSLAQSEFTFDKSLGLTQELYDDIMIYVCNLTRIYLYYSTYINLYIALLFKLQVNMDMLSKNKETGQIPMWSYFVYFPFFAPTFVYTFLHGFVQFGKKNGNEVDLIPCRHGSTPLNLYIGSRYSPGVYDVVVDLTCEFPEIVKINKNAVYLNVQCWDGQPPSPAELNKGVTTVSEVLAKQPKSRILIHCAHGKGRSCIFAVALLVKLKVVKTWEDGFVVVKKGREVVKLNDGMKEVLRGWSEQFM